MAPLAVERRAAAQDEELFGLYREVFGEDLTGASRLRWRWQYLDNPQNEAEGPAIWVARDGTTLLGQYASMPVRLRWGHREVGASWGMDVFVRAEARGRGVGGLLFGTWSDHVEVALGLGLTPSSYGLFRKLGYIDVGPVPFYQKVLDAKAVAVRRLGPKLGRMASPILGWGLGIRHPDRRGNAPPALEVTPITRFEPGYDKLWERVGSSYAMCVRRDAAYLNWKYVDCPHRRYALREARRSGELAGFVVSRHEDFRGLRLGWIIDVFTEEGDEEARDSLVAVALDDFRAAGVARVQAFSLNAALGRALLQRGFMAGPSPMQFCVRARVAADEVFADRGRWHVVFGDSDMDR